MRPLSVFSDFDGTITLRDTNGALFGHFIPTDRQTAFAGVFRSGQSSLWESLDLSMRACEVPLAAAIAYLVETIELDPGFGPFHAWCEQEGLPLSILSAGLEPVIQAFLTRAGLELPVTANQAADHPEHFGLVPLDPSCPTGVDKARVLVDARAAGFYTVFIGDGLSDRLAAPAADLVYAKRGLSLERYLLREGLPFTPYDRFSEIQADLATRLANERSG